MDYVAIERQMALNRLPIPRIPVTVVTARKANQQTRGAAGLAEGQLETEAGRARRRPCDPRGQSQRRARRDRQGAGEQSRRTASASPWTVTAQARSASERSKTRRRPRAQGRSGRSPRHASAAVRPGRPSRRRSRRRSPSIQNTLITPSRREQNGHQAQATADAVQAVLHAGPEGAMLAPIVWAAAAAQQLLLQRRSARRSRPARSLHPRRTARPGPRQAGRGRGEVATRAAQYATMPRRSDGEVAAKIAVGRARDARATAAAAGTADGASSRPSSPPRRRGTIRAPRGRCPARHPFRASGRPCPGGCGRPE